MTPGSRAANAFESLPPDQRAAVELVLRRGQSYGELAALLGIPEGTVRERAHNALEALAPDLPPPPRAAEVADWLLGQQAAVDVAGTRELLVTDAATRRWAETVAGALRELAGVRVPEVPGADLPAPRGNGARRARPLRELPPVAAAPATSGDPPAPEPSPAPPESPPASGTAPAGPVPASGATPGALTSGATPGAPASGATPGAPTSGATPGAPASGATPGAPASGTSPGAPASGATSGAPASGASPGAPASGASPGAPASGDAPPQSPALSGGPVSPAPGRSSRLGGAILIGVVLIAVAVVLVYVLTRGDGGAAPAAETATPPAATAAATAAATGTPVASPNDIVLRGPAGSKSVGLMRLVRANDDTVRFALAAQDVPPNVGDETYSIWLAKDDGAARRLGIAQGQVGKDGVLTTAGPRNEDVADFPQWFATYDAVLVTRDRDPAAKEPGTVILSGDLPNAAG